MGGGKTSYGRKSEIEILRQGVVEQNEEVWKVKQGDI